MKGKTILCLGCGKNVSGTVKGMNKTNRDTHIKACLSKKDHNIFKSFKKDKKIQLEKSECGRVTSTGEY